MSNIKGKHVVITGANGFIGHHLSVFLKKQGYKVSELIRTNLEPTLGLSEKYILDLTNLSKVKKLFSGLKPDFVVHLAATKNRSNAKEYFRETYDQNLLTSLNVIDACLDLKCVKRIVFLGSCDEYGQSQTPFREYTKELPTTAYGISKLAITNILMGLFYSHQLPSVVLRPTVIYGPRQGDEMFLSNLIKTLLKKEKFATTLGEQYRDFVFIDDVVSMISKCLNLDSQINGNVINVGAGVSYTIKEIANLTEELIHPNTKSLLGFGELSYRPNEMMDYSVDISKAKKLLNWVPEVTIENGLKQTISMFHRDI